MNTSRMEKVNQYIKREISSIIQRDMQDPRLEFVSITSVNVSRDLKQAKVYFSVLGGEKQKCSAQKALNSAKGLIRKIVGEHISMRYNPELLFTFDDSIAKIQQIEKTLQEIENERQRNQPSLKEE